jgi:hypothetical protein
MPPSITTICGRSHRPNPEEPGTGPIRYRQETNVTERDDDGAHGEALHPNPAQALPGRLGPR